MNTNVSSVFNSMFYIFGGRILDRLNFNNIRTQFIEAASGHSPPEESIYLDPVSGIHPDSLSFKVSTATTLQRSEFYPFLLSSSQTRSVCTGRMIEINTMVIYVVNCQQYLCHYHGHHDHMFHHDHERYHHYCIDNTPDCALHNVHNVHTLNDWDKNTSIIINIIVSYVSL